MKNIFKFTEKSLHYQILLNYNPDIYIKNMAGLNALDIAGDFNQKEAYETLLPYYTQPYLIKKNN